MVLAYRQMVKYPPVILRAEEIFYLMLNSPIENITPNRYNAIVEIISKLGTLCMEKDLINEVK